MRYVDDGAYLREIWVVGNNDRLIMRYGYQTILYVPHFGCDNDIPRKYIEII